METAHAQAPHLTLGQRLRVSRERLGLTVRDVAAAVPGVSMSGVATMERDGTDPTIGRIAKLAKFYGVDIRWLVEGIDTSGVDPRPNQGQALTVIAGAGKGPRDRPLPLYVQQARVA